MSRRGESGFALATTLLVLLLLSIALGLLAASLQIRMRLVQDEAWGLQLRALSDAALAEALANLAANSFYHGADEHPLGDGTIRSEVHFLDVGRFRVVATANLAGRARAVEAEVLRSPGHTRVVHWKRLTESDNAS